MANKCKIFLFLFVILLVNEPFYCYPFRSNMMPTMGQNFPNPMYRSELIMRNRRKCRPKQLYNDQLPETPGIEDLPEYQRTKPDDIVVMFEDAIMIVVPQCNATMAPCPLDY